MQTGRRSSPHHQAQPDRTTSLPGLTLPGSYSHLDALAYLDSWRWLGKQQQQQQQQLAPSYRPPTYRAVYVGDLEQQTRRSRRSKQGHRVGGAFQAVSCLGEQLKLD